MCIKNTEEFSVIRVMQTRERMEKWRMVLELGCGPYYGICRPVWTLDYSVRDGKPLGEFEYVSGIIQHF